MRNRFSIFLSKVNTNIMDLEVIEAILASLSQFVFTD